MGKHEKPTKARLAGRGDMAAKSLVSEAALGSSSSTTSSKFDVSALLVSVGTYGGFAERGRGEETFNL